MRCRGISASLFGVSVLCSIACAAGTDESGRPPVDYGLAPESGGAGGASTGGLSGTGGIGGSVVGQGGAGGAGGSSGGMTSSGGGGGTGASGSSGGSNGASGSAGSIGSGGSNVADAGDDDSGTSVEVDAGSPSCALTGYLFCDDFEDGNAGGWQKSGGSWSVLTDESFVYVGADGSYTSTAARMSWTDQIVEARVKILDFGGTGSSYRAGIVARAGQSTNYYTLALDESGDVRLLRGTSSPSGASGTCDTEPSGLATLTNTWIDLKIQVTGPAGDVHIQTWVNGGDPIHDCITTSSTLAAGTAGVITYGSGTRAEFDDFRVSAP